jgi:hypothetical protein
LQSPKGVDETCRPWPEPGQAMWRGQGTGLETDLSCPPGSGRDVLSLSMDWRYAATPCPGVLLAASASRVRSSASHAPACSRRLTSAKRTRNWIALRHGRSPSREATFWNALDRSHPLRVARSA